MERPNKQTRLLFTSQPFYIDDDYIAKAKANDDFTHNIISSTIFKKKKKMIQMIYTTKSRNEEV